MKATIYIVSYVNFDGYDDNLYSSVKAFADEQQARQQFEKDCATALADARDEDGCYDEDEWYIVDESKDGDTYRVSRTHNTYYSEVKLEKKEVEVPMPYGLPEPLLKMGDTFQWRLDGKGDVRTSEVEGVELRTERDTDSTLITNVSYLVTNAPEQARLWVYEDDEVIGKI